MSKVTITDVVNGIGPGIFKAGVVVLAADGVTVVAQSALTDFTVGVPPANPVADPPSITVE